MDPKDKRKLDALSIDLFGMAYKELGDDSAEQDYIIAKAEGR